MIRMRLDPFQQFIDEGALLALRGLLAKPKKPSSKWRRREILNGSSGSDDARRIGADSFCEDAGMSQSPGSVVIRSGPWDLEAVEDFFDTTTIPMRLATQRGSWPLVQSLWFLYDGSALWCCTQRNSVVAKRLEKTPQCAFEIAADDPPYRGVRGRGIASFEPQLAGDLLERLIRRYLADQNSSLAGWLRSRVPDEVAIRIDTLAVSSWDYSSRMER